MLSALITEVKINTRQAKILRVMLRLGAFTRKSLAEKTGEDLSYIQQVVQQFSSWLRSGPKLHSGRPGPPEEMLSLRPEGEKAILKELAVLREEAQATPAESPDVSTYIPSPLQYAAARELIDEIEKKSSTLSPARLQRLVFLFSNISANEGLPEEDRIGQSLGKPGTNLTSKQQIAAGRLDILRGKLCWLSLEQPPEIREKFFCSDPGLLGLDFLQSATKIFVQYPAREVAESIDYWSTRRVYSVLFNTLIENPWTALGTLRRRVDSNVLPEVSKAIESIVMPQPPEILDGMLQYYHSYCVAPNEDAVALLDVRHSSMTLAIVERNGPFMTKFLPLPSEEEYGEHEVVQVVNKCLSNYHATPGASAIDRIFVTGEPSPAKSFNNLAPQVIGGNVHIGDFYRPNQLGYPMITLNDGARTKGEFLCAAEVGIALKAAKGLA